MKATSMPRSQIALQAPAGQFLQPEDIRRHCPAVYAKQPIDTVSSRYRFLSTELVIDELATRGFRPVRVHTATAKSGLGENRVHIPAPFGAHMVVFEPSEPMRIGNDSLQFVILNSHDRSRRLRAAAGLFRVVCDNGLIAGSSELQIDTAHLETKEVGSLISAVSEVMGHLTHLHEEVDRMRAVTLSPRRQGVLARKAAELRWGKGFQRDAARCLLESRRAEDDHDDLWTVFNRLQENIVKGGVRWPGTSPMPTFELTKPKQLFAFNSALWNAALAMIN